MLGLHENEMAGNLARLQEAMPEKVFVLGDEPVRKPPIKTIGVKLDKVLGEDKAKPGTIVIVDFTHPALEASLNKPIGEQARILAEEAERLQRILHQGHGLTSLRVDGEIPTATDMIGIFRQVPSNLIPPSPITLRTSTKHMTSQLVRTNVHGGPDHYQYNLATRFSEGILLFPSVVNIPDPFAGVPPVFRISSLQAA